MRKQFSISIVWQVAALMLVFITGAGPSFTALQGFGDQVGVVSSVSTQEDHSADDKQPFSEDREEQEVISALHATLPVAPFHINVLPALAVANLPRIEFSMPPLPRMVAPATQVYFKTLFRRIISPNAP
ncbi:hypothetical protein AB9P05_10245 [Roseivirga sp. BDSF3-8]|uniref:hypothetical protein n=1 Tax=Roseivirga sp. BDSF3-8 TaxID=3241598 RepID=UPI00353235BA